MFLADWRCKGVVVVVVVVVPLEEAFAAALCFQAAVKHMCFHAAVKHREKFYSTLRARCQARN